MDWKIAAIAVTIIVALPIGLGYALAIEDVEHTAYAEGDQSNITQSLLNATAPYFLEHSGYTDNLTFLNGSNLAVPASYNRVTDTFTGIRDISVGDVTDIQTVNSWRTLTIRPFMEITIPGDPSEPRPIEFRLTDGSGSVHMIYDNPPYRDKSFTYSDGVVSGNYFAEVYTNIKTIEYRGVAPFEGQYGYFELETAIYSGQYADWTYGERVNSYWRNGAENGEVLITVNGSATIIGYDSVGHSSQISVLRDGSGYVTVNGESLGRYQFVRVQVAIGQTVVYGCPGSNWPAVNAQISAAKVITIDNGLTSVIPKIYMSGNVRIDHSARAIGSYPVMTNVVFSPVNIWPSADSYTLTLSRIDTMGDYLEVGGTRYEITDGRIQIGTRAYTLAEGFTIRSEYDNAAGLWKNAINGHTLESSDELPRVTLGGTWSAIATSAELELSTWTSSDWQPGQFALDDENFALAGLIGCLAVFVALGIYGRRSGAKVGALLLICGGGSLFFLMLI